MALKHRILPMLLRREQGCRVDLLYHGGRRPQAIGKLCGGIERDRALDARQDMQTEPASSASQLDGAAIDVKRSPDVGQVALARPEPVQRHRHVAAPVSPERNHVPRPPGRRRCSRREPRGRRHGGASGRRQGRGQESQLLKRHIPARELGVDPVARVLTGP